MAAKVEDQNERYRRIYLVYKYYIETGLSYRKLSEYIKEKENIRISSVTIGAYLKEIKKFLNKKQIEEIDSINEQHKAHDIKYKEVEERVLKATYLCFNGKTVEQISEALNEGYWTIYNDLKVRLKLLDEEKYKCVLDILQQNSMNNLKK